MPYWTQAQLEARVSRETVRNILDDDNEGSANAEAVLQLQQDSDAYVDGYLRGIYDLAEVKADPPNQVRRLSLDYAVAQLYKRHPEYPREGWTDMEASVRKDCEALRAGKIRLDIVGPPEPAANEGGDLLESGTDGGIVLEPCLIFNKSGGFGDF